MKSLRGLCWRGGVVLVIGLAFGLGGCPPQNGEPNDANEPNDTNQPTDSNEPDQIIDPALAARIAEINETFSTSLHRTRAGKAFFYSRANGGFETLTNVALANVKCEQCHSQTLANGQPVAVTSFYQMSCGDCHARIGDRPVDTVCLGCHSRQGAERNIFDVAAGQPDVHRAAGLQCVACHTDKEMHGNGTLYNSMLDETPADADCRNCHTDLPVDRSHRAHLYHIDTVDCVACHARSVVSCFNCHFDSEVAGGTKRWPNILSNFSFLMRRQGSGLVTTGTMMSLVTGTNKSFVVLAPYAPHTIAPAAQAKQCGDCHNNANVQAITAGSLQVTRFDEATKKIVGPSGVVPVPENWQQVFKFQFANYIGNAAAATTDPSSWVFMKDGVNLFQMLYAEPLRADQMAELRNTHD